MMRKQLTLAEFIRCRAATTQEIVSYALGVPVVERHEPFTLQEFIKVCKPGALEAVEFARKTGERLDPSTTPTGIIKRYWGVVDHVYVYENGIGGAVQYHADRDLIYEACLASLTNGWKENIWAPLLMTAEKDCEREHFFRNIIPAAVDGANVPVMRAIWDRISGPIENHIRGFYDSAGINGDYYRLTFAYRRTTRAIFAIMVRFGDMKTNLWQLMIPRLAKVLPDDVEWSGLAYANSTSRMYFVLQRDAHPVVIAALFDSGPKYMTYVYTQRLLMFNLHAVPTEWAHMDTLVATMRLINSTSWGPCYKGSLWALESRDIFQAIRNKRGAVWKDKSAAPPKKRLRSLLDIS